MDLDMSIQFLLTLEYLTTFGALELWLGHTLSCYGRYKNVEIVRFETSVVKELR